MSKLIGHLLQTTPLVLATSLAAQQGVNATTTTVESVDTPAAIVADAEPLVALESTAAETIPTEAFPENAIASPLPNFPERSPVPTISEPPPSPAPATIADFRAVQTNAAALQPVEIEVQPFSPVEAFPETTAEPIVEKPDPEPIFDATPAVETVVESPEIEPTDPDTLASEPKEQEALEPAVSPTTTLPYEEVVEVLGLEPQAESAIAEPVESSELTEALVITTPSEPATLPTLESVETPVVIEPTSDDLVVTEPELEESELDAAIADLPPVFDDLSLEDPSDKLDELSDGLEDVPRQQTVVGELILHESGLEESGLDAAIADLPPVFDDLSLDDPSDELDLDELSDGLEAAPEQPMVAGELVLQESELDAAIADLPPVFDELSLDAMGELPAATEVELSVDDLLQQANQYATEETNSTLGQGVPGAMRFSDVSPTDWAYTALDDISRRYGCLRGYPNGTFRGGRSLTRYEFAAGLNACIQQIERLITQANNNATIQADLDVMERLLREFATELARVKTQVDGLDSRVTFLEDHQFSTTTKLEGEVLFTVADLFTESQQFDDNYDGTIDALDSTFSGAETTFQDRVRLNLLTSFNGRDRLQTRLQARNAVQFDPLTGIVTNEGRWGFASNTNENNNVTISDLNYRTPIGDNVEFLIAPIGLTVDEMVDTLNPFDSSGGGAISRFGQSNPIYNTGTQDAGVALTLNPGQELEITAGYTNNTASDPSSGVFNGGYNFTGQMTLRPSDAFAIAATFSHAYGEDSLSLDSGSRGANLGRAGSRGVNATGQPVVSNSYGVQALFNLSKDIFFGGWGGYTWARVLDRGDADIWNYAGFLGVNDLGGEGNQLGVIVGMEPRLAGTDGLGVGRADRNAGLHIEGFYRIRVNKNVNITPGVIWLTAPDHNHTNSDMIAGVLRTQFSF